MKLTGINPTCAKCPLDCKKRDTLAVVYGVQPLCPATPAAK